MKICVFSFLKSNNVNDNFLSLPRSNMTAYIEPLKVTLTELDSNILEQQDRISILKCSILKNASRTQTLLSAVSVQTG